MGINWLLGKKKAEPPAEAVEIPREGATKQYQMSHALPLELFENLATEAGAAIMLCAVIMPRVPNDGGGTVLPGIQWAKRIGSNAKGVFEFFSNNELVTAYVEEFAAECKKYYDKVEYTINRRDDDHERDGQA